MKHLRLIGLLITSSLLVFLLGCPEDPEIVADYSVELVGENQVPSVASTATGSMDVELDEDNLLIIDGEFDDLVSRLTEVAGSSAHIHEGSTGEEGPVLYNIEVDADDDERSGTFRIEQTLTDDEVDLFLNEELYVNIHTNAYPAGEIRGQLDENAPEFANIDNSWGVEMTPQAQPHAVDSDADGWAWVIVRDDDSMVVSGAAQNLSSALSEIEGSAVNIEQGEPAQDVLLNLEYEVVNDADNTNTNNSNDTTNNDNNDVLGEFNDNNNNNDYNNDDNDVLGEFNDDNDKENKKENDKENDKEDRNNDDNDVLDEFNDNNGILGEFDDDNDVLGETDDDVDDAQESGVRFWGATTLSDDQREIFGDGDYYITIYTEEHQSGELRGNFDEEDDFFQNVWEDLFGDDEERIDEIPPF